VVFHIVLPVAADTVRGDHGGIDGQLGHAAGGNADLGKDSGHR
jgi:hypothetical protein